MTREATERVLHALLSASAALNEALSIVQIEGSDEMFKNQRKCTAELLGTIYIDLVKPLVASYPDLDPGRDGEIS
jgi:hypothetical protein